MRLRESRSAPSIALEQVGIGLDLIGDQPALELGRGGDELERRMGDDDAVPLRGRGARQKPLALVLDEIGLVGDQDSGGRVELQELAARLGEAMTGHDHHRLGDETQPLLLHDRGGEREGLSRSDGVGDIGRAGSDDPPDRPLLVGVEIDDAGGAGNCQMRPVEVPGDEVVEAVVVNPRQPVGAFDVLPHPGLERRLDFHELVLGGFGVGGVEDPFLDPVLLELVVDLRQRGVEGVHQEFAGMATGCAPVGRGARQASEGMDVDRPARDLDRVIDRRFDAKDLFREGGDNVGRYPRRAEARGDVGGLEVLGQGLFERRDIALITRIERGGGLGGRELVADLAREIGVGRHPDFAVHGDRRLGIEENALAEFGDRRLARPAEKLGDAVEIDEARLVQRNGERVLGRLDHRRRLRMEHALAKDRSMLRRSAFEIVILDRGDEPDVGVVEEGLEVWPTEGLARLALGRHGLADRRQVDRAEVADEERVGRAQPDLRRSPGFIIRLRAQNLADGVANGDQAADDAGVLRGDPLRPLAVAHGDGLRLAADDLDEDALMDEIAALLDRRPFGGRADPHRRMEGRLRSHPRRP